MATLAHPPPSSPPLMALNEVSFTLNGEVRRYQVEAWTTLLDLLRENARLSGTKKGCDHGQCGACTVLLDGRNVLSCLTLALMCEGAEIVTIEGVGTEENPDPLQQAFIDHDAFQCGYCTPGQICSAKALLAKGGELSDDEIREWMSGNLCRCGAYTNILAAIRRVVERGKEEGKPP